MECNSLLAVVPGEAVGAAGWMLQRLLDHGVLPRRFQTARPLLALRAAGSTACPLLRCAPGLPVPLTVIPPLLRTALSLAHLKPQAKENHHGTDASLPHPEPTAARTRHA